MPIWVLETFGQDELTQAFLLVSLMTAPFWLAMLTFPSSKLVQHLMHPLLFPSLLAGFVVGLGWFAWSMGVTLPEGTEYRHIRRYFRHPLPLLVLWAQIQVLHLFVGAVLFREAGQRNMRIPAELVIAWASGPLALPVFAIRLMLRRFQT